MSPYYDDGQIIVNDYLSAEFEPDAKTMDIYYKDDPTANLKLKSISTNSGPIKEDRWAFLTCHKGWNKNHNSTNIMMDIAKTCEKTDDKTKDCFQLCLLRELEIIYVKKVKGKVTYHIDNIFAHRFSPLFLLLSDDNDEEIEQTILKLGAKLFKKCFEAFKQAKDIPNCSDSKWTEFYKCAEQELGCS